jgi:hypothetical protein
VPIDAAQVGTLWQQRFGWRAAAVERAGADEARHDAAAIAAVAAGDRPLVVLAEGFEAPTREARGFVQKLRAAGAADRPIVVALVDSDERGRFTAPTADDLRVWTRQLAGLGDPYLRVEALVEDPAVSGSP